MPTLPRPLDDSDLDTVIGGFSSHFRAPGTRSRPLSGDALEQTIRDALADARSTPGRTR